MLLSLQNNRPISAILCVISTDITLEQAWCFWYNNPEIKV